MNTEQLARRNIGLNPILTTVNYTGSAPSPRPTLQGVGVDISDAMIAVVAIKPPAAASVVVDIYTRTYNSSTWEALNGLINIEIDDRGWKETLRVATDDEIAVVITKSSVPLDQISVKIGPAMG